MTAATRAVCGCCVVRAFERRAAELGLTTTLESTITSWELYVHPRDVLPGPEHLVATFATLSDMCTCGDGDGDSADKIRDRKP